MEPTRILLKRHDRAYVIGCSMRVGSAVHRPFQQMENHCGALVQVNSGGFVVDVLSRNLLEFGHCADLEQAC